MRSFALFLLPLLAVAQEQVPAPCLDKVPTDRAYTRVRLIDVVRDQTPMRAEYLIRTCGVRVAFNKDLEADLREAGAEENVLVAVREVAVKPVVVKQAEPPPAPVPTSPKAGDIRTNPKDRLRYVYVPPGTFRMGCATTADGPCDADEKPAHDVRISKGFWMGQTEVTTEAYKRFASATGRQMPPEPEFGGKKLNAGWNGEQLPMTMVSWTDSKDYCEWAGLGLPTEAEWEYAARAGTSGAHYANVDDIAWYGNNSGDRVIDTADIFAKDFNNYGKRILENGNRTHPVGQKKANAFRMYDMLGNVWEWTADWYKASYEGENLEVDPTGRPGGEYRVLRGGSWYDFPSNVRASNRVRYLPSDRYFYIGFRCRGEIPVP